MTQYAIRNYRPNTDTLPVERARTRHRSCVPRKEHAKAIRVRSRPFLRLSKRNCQFQQSGTQNGLSVYQQIDSLCWRRLYVRQGICDGVSQVPLRVYQSALDGKSRSRSTSYDTARESADQPQPTRHPVGLVWSVTITNLLLTAVAYWLKAYDNPDSPKRNRKSFGRCRSHGSCQSRRSTTARRIIADISGQRYADPARLHLPLPQLQPQRSVHRL